MPLIWKPAQTVKCFESRGSNRGKGTRMELMAGPRGLDPNEVRISKPRIGERLGGRALT